MMKLFVCLYYRNGGHNNNMLQRMKSAQETVALFVNAHTTRTQILLKMADGIAGNGSNDNNRIARRAGDAMHRTCRDSMYTAAAAARLHQ